MGFNAVQTSSIYAGLVDVVPARAISLCTWHELELFVCGDPHIDVDALRAHSTFHGYSSGDKACKLLWRVLEGFTDDQRSRFLRFVWGRSRLPRGGAWDRPFKISRRDGGDAEMPIGHTCFNQLEWPNYSCEEVARQRLLTAIIYGLDGFLIA